MSTNVYLLCARMKDRTCQLKKKKTKLEGKYRGRISVRETKRREGKKEKKKKERFARSRFEQRVHTVHLQEGVQHLSRTQTTANGLRQPGRFKVGGLSELSLPLGTSFIRTIMRFTCFLLYTDENVHT